MTRKERARLVRQRVSTARVAEALGLGPGPKIECLWHGPDKTPSLHIYPGPRGSYCFGCGKDASVIDLVMESKGFEFPEALEWIEENVGVPEGPTTDEPSIDYSKQEDDLWLQAHAEVIQIVRPLLLTTSDEEYEKVKDAIWNAYEFWDLIVEAARDRGESRTKVLQKAAGYLRNQLEQARCPTP